MFGRWSLGRSPRPFIVNLSDATVINERDA